MSFSVHDATLADCPTLATVSLAAFKDDPIVGYLARDVLPDVFQAYQCQQYQRRLQTSALNGLRVFKVVDDETEWVVLNAHIETGNECVTQWLDEPSVSTIIHKVLLPLTNPETLSPSRGGSIRTA